jgi:hypothetical protein
MFVAIIYPGPVVRNKHMLKSCNALVAVKNLALKYARE